MEVFFGLCNLLSWCDFFDQDRFFFFVEVEVGFSNSDFFDLYKLEPHPLKGDSVSQSILCHLS